MNIVLGTSPVMGSLDSVGFVPPLGLMYLAGNVRSLPGVNVRIVDGLSEGLTLEQATDKVVDLSPDIFGLTVWSTTIGRGLKLLRAVKAALPETLTILGGPHATLFDGLLLREVSELDMLFRGEGEHGFRELCQRLAAGQDIAGIPGLSFRSNGRVVRGEPQTIDDLDSLPLPARDVLKYDGYFTNWGGWHIPDFAKSATLLTSRGCPYHCTFCARLTPELGKWRPRSTENVFEELRQLSEEGCRTVYVVDENFTVDIARLRQLCEMLLKNNLGLEFLFEGALHHIDDSTLKLMHKAGFRAVIVGVESGSDAQLKRFNKPARSEEMAAGIRRAKKAHMIVGGFFIVGGPGETDEDAEASLKFLREVRPHVADNTILHVYPGSPLWRKLNSSNEPATLEAAQSRMGYEYPGQVPKETVDRRVKDFRETFGKTWLDWRRIFEVFDLVLHNPTVRSILKVALRRPGILLQMVRHPKSQ